MSGVDRCLRMEAALIHQAILGEQMTEDLESIQVKPW
jgi:hypothetical protein